VLVVDVPAAIEPQLLCLPGNLLQALPCCAWLNALACIPLRYYCAFLVFFYDSNIPMQLSFTMSRNKEGHQTYNPESVHHLAYDFLVILQRDPNSVQVRVSVPFA
jgi:hypothetical protein